MNQKSTIAIVIACIVSLVTSTIALCLSIPRSQELNFDYLGLLIGIQSFIVALLLGWNIYCLVDLKGLRGEQDKIKIDHFLNLQRLCAITCHAASDVFYRYLVGGKPNGDDYNLMYYRISEIYHISLIGDNKTCEILITSLLQIFREPHKCNFREAQMTNLWNLITRVKGQESIPNFDKLTAMVAQMSDKVRI